MPFRPPHRPGLTPGTHGRFPGFDVLAQAGQWDQVTAGVVLSRLTPPALSFFTEAQIAVAGPLFDVLLAQDKEPKVPVLELVDARLAAGETDGWHYDDMPSDPTAWRETLAALDDDARERYGIGYAEATTSQQARLIQDIQDLAGADRDWHRWPAGRVWSLWTRYACAAFYSHPWAWNEIGFSGPAYPRGYLNPGINALESFEVTEAAAADPAPFARRIERARRADADLPDRYTDG